MTSHKSKQNSKPSGNLTKCFECSSMEKRYKDPSKNKFCTKHQCPVLSAPNITCSIKKKSSEACCTNHYVPPCAIEGCRRYCVNSSCHCEIHSCSFRNCLHEARPGHGRAFCDDHTCSDSGCPSLRKFYETIDCLVMAPFCHQHECLAPGCNSRKYPRNGEFPGKDYCVAHCCNVAGCPERREGGALGPLCLDHYNESIRKATFEQYQREDRVRADKAAREAAAAAAADERRRMEEATAHAQFEAQRRREYEAREREGRGHAKQSQRSSRPAGYTPRSTNDSFTSWNEHDETQERTTFSDPRRQAPHPYEKISARFGRRSPQTDRTRGFEHPSLRREDAYREDSYVHSDYDEDRDSAYRSGNGYGSASKRSSGASFRDFEQGEHVFGFDQREPKIMREPPRDYYPRQDRWGEHRENMRGW